MNRRINRMLLVLPVLAVVAFALSVVAGCNTVEGVGDDISSLSRGVSGKAADDPK